MPLQLLGGRPDLVSNVWRSDYEGAWFACWMGSVQGYVEGLHFDEWTSNPSWVWRNGCVKNKWWWWWGLQTWILKFKTHIGFIYDIVICKLFLQLLFLDLICKKIIIVFIAQNGKYRRCYIWKDTYEKTVQQQMSWYTCQSLSVYWKWRTDISIEPGKQLALLILLYWLWIFVMDDMELLVLSSAVSQTIKIHIILKTSTV